MNRFWFLGIIILIAQAALGQKATTGTDAASARRSLPVANGTPAIDGQGDDAAWKKNPWRLLDQNWIGAMPNPQDCKGRYKLAWDDSCLYVLAQIVDDTLIDTHQNPLERYWDDDCLEVFLDEDASGGNHQYSHQAFAYHLSLNGKDVADVDVDSSFILLNRHVEFKMQTEQKPWLERGGKPGREVTVATWECRVRIYGPDFKVGNEKQARKRLKKDQKIGFALAYCDNDRSRERENFIGSVPVEGKDKNRGWIDAGIFQTLILQ